MMVPRTALFSECAVLEKYVLGPYIDLFIY